jgi:hypothetical protein
MATLVDHDQASQPIRRAVVEHLRLHARVRSLRRELSRGQVDPEMILSIADLLETHVRFEEQELFPLIEDLIPEEDL